MSASMYNSPYTYREAPRRIEYPPLFSGMKFSLKHVLSSRFLAIAALVLGLALVVTLVCIINPFWFELVMSPSDGTFGSLNPIIKLTINAGLFYLRESEMDNMLFLNHFNGRDVVPKSLAVAELASVIGTCMLVCCVVACVILVFRKFSSPTALIILAFFTTITAIFQIAAFVCALITVRMSSCDFYSHNCDYSKNLAWCMLPMYKQMYRVEPLLTPYIKPNWAFYIFIFSCILVTAGAVLLWLETISTLGKVSEIRYQQLRQTRSPHEADDSPELKKVLYNPPTVHGTHSYGMQPVVHSSGPYGQPLQHPPPSHGPPVSFAPEPKKHRSSPPARRGSPPPGRRGPPSETSSTSGAYVSREIDL